MASTMLVACWVKAFRHVDLPAFISPTRPSRRRCRPVEWGEEEVVVVVLKVEEKGGGRGRRRVKGEEEEEEDHDEEDGNNEALFVYV